MNVTKDKVSSIFFKYSIPSVLGMLAISSASIVDGYFIGNYVGDLGLAAINISLPAYNGVFEQCFQKYLNTFDKNIF